MFSEPLLTIVIPCFNEERNLNRLSLEIDQILAQTELVSFILVDNGSQDKTREGCQLICDSNPERIKLLKIDKNIGYGNGLIKGIEISKTKLTGWVHADLQAPLNSILISLDILKDNETIGVKGIRTHRSLRSKVLSLGMQFFASMICLERFVEINAQPTIAPTHFLKSISFFSKNSSFDFEVYLNLKKHLHIERILIKEEKRIDGESHWQKNTFSKAVFILNTMRDIISIRNFYKNT